MPELNVTSRNGIQKTVAGEAGLNVMEVLRENGYDEIQAMCGGVCSCATCHVFVAPEDMSRLPPMSEDEDDLLDGTEHRRRNSRLSCQIILTDELGGLGVTIAPED